MLRRIYPFWAESARAASPAPMTLNRGIIEAPSASATRMIELGEKLEEIKEPFCKVLKLGQDAATLSAILAGNEDGADEEIVQRLNELFQSERAPALPALIKAVKDEGRYGVVQPIVSALFKEGGYLSFDNYILRTRAEHISMKSGADTWTLDFGRVRK